MSATSLRKAQLYENHRLPYAPELVEGLLEHTGEIQTLADIGAGTGQLARLLAHRCRKVYAVEPDPAMRQVAALALSPFSNLEILAAFAEELPFADRSLDLIVIGNAFHRFRTEACAELHRALKPNGWIVLVSYAFLDEDFTNALSTKLAGLKGLSSRIDRAWHKPSLGDLFGQNEIHTMSYRQSCSEDWNTFFGAACAGIEAPEPGDAEFRHFELITRQIFDTFALDGKIRMDYETRVSCGQPVTSKQIM